MALALAALVAPASCSTQEPPAFSDGACVAGGCAGTGATTSSSSGGVACVVNPSCTVSWATDVFAGIVDGPAGCTSMTCHGGGMGGITLASGDAHDSYVALTAYSLTATPGPVKRYIVPCDPTDSGFPCNMAVGAGGDADAGANAYGTCGAPMPIILAGETPLTADQVTKIADWITCGAPEN